MMEVIKQITTTLKNNKPKERTALEKSEFNNKLSDLFNGVVNMNRMNKFSLALQKSKPKRSKSKES